MQPIPSPYESDVRTVGITYEADLLQARSFLAFQTYALVTALYLGLAILLRRVLNLGGRVLLGAAR